MKKILLLFAVFAATIASADVKISDLPLGSAALTGANDSFPYVDASAGVTRRLKLSDLPNIPNISSAIKRTVNTVSVNTTIPTLTKDYILNVNTGAGSVTVTLPSATGSDTFCVDIKKIH